MTRNTLTIGSAVLVLASLGLALAPGADDDFTSLPPEHSVMRETLQALPINLADAVNTAEAQLQGKAHSATFNVKNDPATIEVVVYSGNTAQRAHVDTVTGVVREVTNVSRFPGWYTSGEWTETESGVKYSDLAVGEGAPVVGDDPILRFHFQGFFVNGDPWGNTYEGDQPAEAPLSQLLPGWIEGVQGMNAGGKRKIIVPAELGFGLEGRPPQIPAAATLIIDVEILDVVDYEMVPDVLPGDDVMGVEPVTTDSGMVYYDLECGEGEMPSGPQARVRVHYTGYLNDGTVFDSTIERNEPAEFPLSGVIPGWTEGVGSMTVGSRRKLVIPFELAYGAAGRPPVIPPRATLIFDIQLLEILPDAPPVPPPAGPGGSSTGGGDR